ncbi:MAG: class I SAM-dependent methyltransferase [Syntrophotaleaceae bacterium]
MIFLVRAILGPYGKCPTPEILKENVCAVNPGFDCNRLRIVKGDSGKLVFEDGDVFRFAHVDGGHSYDECLVDMEICAPKLVINGVMVVDYQHQVGGGDSGIN